ncbi:hypothetical protein BAE44_0006663 [Dichanthelium oligosanthes]|uniref:EF-hand domain-containing protein n=1 Tax=Dichanthelium oligosanthes TaxID=888268 RepID=A0A1E5W4S9_9POAL|nr:hypothetical protein BAE44_0006663 [Dichanthelium oligosanthes]
MAKPPAAAAARKPSAASTVALTLSLAFASAGLLFLLLRLSPSSPSPTPHPHRRLRLRARAHAQQQQQHHQIPFDPVFAGLERRLEDREWERLAAAGLHAPGMEAAPVPGDLSDGEAADAGADEDYLNDAARFNVTRRVEELFPRIDVAPADGAVTGDELAAWNLANARREVLHRTARELELHDRDHDGRLAFGEYERPSWAWRFDGTYMERDKDNDGKLNFQEFFSGLFYSIRHYDDEGITDDTSGSDAPAKKSFSHLDLDNDGLLSADELKPIIGNLHPSEHFYAKQQADYVISQADTNKDGQLSMKEMIENPYVFYNALFTEDDYGFHDELR